MSSQAEAVEQQVEPLRYQGAAAAARAKLLTVLNGMARVKIVTSDPDRITAEFRSALFGFVDDVVFQFGSSGASGALGVPKRLLRFRRQPRAGGGDSRPVQRRALMARYPAGFPQPRPLSRPMGRAVPIPPQVGYAVRRPGNTIFSLA